MKIYAKDLRRLFLEGSIIISEEFAISSGDKSISEVFDFGPETSMMPALRSCSSSRTRSSEFCEDRMLSSFRAIGPED
jgi:hypothetical protein